MRSFLLFSYLLMGFVLSAQTNGNADMPVSMDSLFRKKAMESEGKPFQTFSAEFDGHLLSKDSLKGKVVFINFWFEACPPCIAELEALNNLYKEFSSNSDFEFLSFTYESPARIKFLKKKYHIKYKIASVSTQECYRLNQNNGFPTSIILDKGGIIRHLFTGGSDQKAEAEKIIYNTVFKYLNEELKN